MERLTKGDFKHDVCCQCKHYGEPNGCNRSKGTCGAYDSCLEVWDKLADLEDAEEQGRLVVLPCKVGDTVYKTCKKWNRIKIGDLWDGKTVKTNCDRCPYGACGCEWMEPDIGNSLITELANRSFNWIVKYRKSFGKTIFLTREAAENALKEG